jgi:hypothetical protein
MTTNQQRLLRDQRRRLQIQHEQNMNFYYGIVMIAFVICSPIVVARVFG